MAKFGEISSIEDFDPSEVDVSRIQAYSKLIPADGHIALEQAEMLATQFLAAANYVSELLPKAVRYVAHVEALVKAAKSQAFADIKGSATLAKGLVDKDQRVIDALDKQAAAVALKEYLEEKASLFVKAHHHSKDLLRRYSGYSGVEEISTWAPNPEKARPLTSKELENETWD